MTGKRKLRRNSGAVGLRGQRFTRLRFEPLESRQLLNAGPIISEFLASNDGGFADEDGLFPDWIELYNPTMDPVNFEGWYLTDNASDLTKWPIPGVTLDPGGYLLVFASGKDRRDPAGPLHANFQLSTDGEYLALTHDDPGGIAVASSFAPVFSDQFENISYGVPQQVDVLVDDIARLSYHVPTADDVALEAAWTERLFDDVSWTSGRPTSPILITEAGIGSTDFIEIQNVSSTSIDTSGWTLVVNDAEDGEINDMVPTTWELPSSMAADEVQYRSDDMADNYWGEDIWWASDGGGWAMILDDGSEVVDFVVWGYSPTDVASFDVWIDGSHITAAGSWSGQAVSAASGGSQSLKRTGTSDHDSVHDFDFSSPDSIGLRNTGLITPFPDQGTGSTVSGIGYDNHLGLFDVTFCKANVTVSNLTIAEQVLADPTKQTSTASGTATLVNFMNTGASGHYGSDAPFPSTTIGTDVNNFVTQATATVILPSAGAWTFGVNSDDGFLLELTNGIDTFSSTFTGTRGASDTLATFGVVTPGIYDLRLVTFDGSGGSSVELFAAQGTHTIFDSTVFDLVGDTSAGGLALAGFGGMIRTDVESEIHSINSSLWVRIPFDVEDPTAVEALQLYMRYNDGFIAYINGQQMAARNAPATPHWASTATAVRPLEDSVVPEIIDISSAANVLEPGINVLAIHGLNASAADDEFLVLPEIWSTTTGVGNRYFATPTPGAPNRSGVLDFVEEPAFSVEHGFFDEPFFLELSTPTPDATIRYTLDGSEPTETAGILYTGPIKVDHTQVVRTSAFKLGYEGSLSRTRTYFFLDDILTQSSDGSPPAGWPTSPINGQVLNYGMDPDIVNDPIWGPQMEDALTTIPSISLVTDVDNLFDPTTGIYVNAMLRGSDWERFASVELIDPVGTEGFQANAGLRIRGGYSRGDGNPKHAWRLFFRGEYGDSKLKYPLFDDEGVDEFDNIDLRTAQNYSWSFGGDARNLMLRDIFSRDTQREMGQPYTRGRYYHLYLNGQYWGLYQSEERPESSFGASYLGGDSENFDTIKSSGRVGGYQTEVTDGNIDAWQELWNQGIAGFDTDAGYYKVQGLNPDGTRNPDYPVLVDINNLIDYMIIILYSGNRDAPISKFLSNNKPNNWFGIRDRTGETGFTYLAHDSEHTLLVADLNENRNGPWPAGDTLNYSNPQWFHQELMAHPDYLMRFADRVQECFFNDGLLTPDSAIARFLARASEIDSAIIAESARWGDSKRASPRTKTDWQNTLDATIASYFPQRTDVVLGQFRNTVLRDGTPAPLYPTVDAPSFSQHGGDIPTGYPLFISATSGTVYYTLDGSDPRLADGSISPNALLVDGLLAPISLIARGSTWKYLDDGSDQNTPWRDASFDDSTWASGPAKLGYGDGNEQTTVSFGPDSANKHITTYLRRTFNATDTQDISGLSLNILRDDGAIVYLNGQEILRTNMPGGAIDYQTRASASVGAAAEQTFFEFSIDPAFLIEGENCLAVELHQIGPNSSDLGFDLELEAVLASTPIIIDDSTNVQARAMDTDTWSALNGATFFVGQAASASNLSIVELNYHPADPTAAELAIDPLFTAGDFEFVEILNTSDEPVDMTGVRFISGITFDFTGSSISPLPPGGRAVVVSNRSAFDARYGTAIVTAGEFVGQLSDGGETLTLLDRFDRAITSFDYNDSGSWPGRADGKGSSLERIDPDGFPDDPDNWRSSTEFSGSPGTAGMGPFADVIVNELMANPTAPGGDWIELFNTTSSPIDISGWYVSDSSDLYRKFRVPDGTTLAPDGYLVFDESDFNASGGFSQTDFALSPDGEDVWLLTTDAGGHFVRFADHVEFDAAPVDVSYGCWPNGNGPFVLMGTRTPQAENTQPLVGNIVINELHVAPDVKTEPVEYVELFNAGEVAVDLSGWHFSDGIQYTFSPGTLLAPGGYLVVSQDPIAVEQKYGVASQGPFVGRLSNDGERLVLRDADDIKQDQVDYGLGFPWPTVGDSPGESIELILSDLDNDLGGSWRSSNGNTPGSKNSAYAANAPPQMRQVDHTPEQPAVGEPVTITAKATDPDGVAAVTLDYQIVTPGDYIAIDDPRYATDWTQLVMLDDGIAGDAAPGDDIYTVVLPGVLQSHRQMIRYRINVEDTLGASVTAPYDDDPQPNFAYFVYNSVPVWVGSSQPGVDPDVAYSGQMLDDVPVYHLITTRTDHERSQYIPDSSGGKYTGSEYRWDGALVYDGQVYDHIRYRARGGVWRYAMGKNMWKFDFNRGHGFQARDDYGEKYDTTWDKLNFSALIQQGNFLQRGEQGLFEAVGFKLHNLADNPAPNTNAVHFRIIENADETGTDQFSSDFQGLYLAIEQLDGQFLNEHDLPDGNFYKMEGGTGTLNNQGPTQPSDRSDLDAFINTYESGLDDVAWWQANLDLDQYYSFRAIAIAIHDYDMHAGKNYFYYHNPETDKWSVTNWDLDLTWTTTYNGGGGRGPLNQYVFDHPELRIAYNNRLRELIDLMFNVEQTGRMLDEYARKVDLSDTPSMVDADRAMWDYNPILTSSYIRSSKAGQGKYYEDSPTDDFAGMVQKLKNYVGTKVDTYLAGGVFDPNVASDEGQQPDRPTAVYTGPVGYPIDQLTFKSSALTGGSGNFAAIEWRIARITDPNSADFDPNAPMNYEITADWQSGEITPYSDSIRVPGEGLLPGMTYRVRSRMKDDAGRFSHWSEPVQFVAGSAVGPLADYLRISEIMYHPLDPSAEELSVDPLFESDDFEFIELTNTGPDPLDLSGVTFNDGVIHTFGDVTIEPGSFILIVRNESAFEARYGTGLPVVGTYSGRLVDSGETIELVDGFTRQVLLFDYDDSGDWPGRADGKGSSLEVVQTSGDYTDSDNWRSSTEYHGSPGEAGIGPLVDIVINEVLSHTDPPWTDSVELLNTTSLPIDIGGWYLSDTSSNYQKFRIPDGTVLPAAGYHVFDESDFNASAGVDPNDFAFDGAHGEDAWLLATDAGGNLTRFVDHVDFGPASNGESFGRWPNGSGDLVPMESITVAAYNSGPRVGPVVFSEVMYHPVDPGDGTNPDDLEFVEIYNASQSDEVLSGWQISGGIDFDFPDDTILPFGGVMVVLPFDPLEPLNALLLANFRTTYGVDETILTVGGYQGRLSNGGETIRLLRPDEPPVDDPLFTPMLLEDEVAYRDALPWPDEPDGTGPSLDRLNPSEWGNDPAGWIAADPTPGSVDYAPTTSLDVDDNGFVDALTDGILILRYLFGFTDQPLIHNVMSSDAMRSDPDEIIAYLDAARDTLLDPDASGLADALTDGIVILRYLFGFRSDQLLSGALASDANRTNPYEIAAYLDRFRPSLSAPSASSPLAGPVPQGAVAADLTNTLVLSEIMAVNNTTFADSDAEYHDWIEIHNPTDVSVDLGGWYLTDNASDLMMWAFPSVDITPGGYITVFASGKDRSDPASELHANFKLSSDGEYLGLIHPDGLTIAHEFSPIFPRQLADISYGPVDLESSINPLVTSEHRLSYHLPEVADDVTAWTFPDFDDSDWIDSVPVDSPGLVVTEIGTGTTKFVEIENVSDATLDTSGWTVWVNDASSSDINIVASTAWNLPASMAIGEVLYQTDDPADTYWGTSIPWDSEGPGWVLILDDVGTVVDYVAWGYSSSQIEAATIDVGGFVDITPVDQWQGDGASVGSIEPGPSIGFTAFNDHIAGAATQPNATTFSTNTTAAGLLKDIATGVATSVTLSTSQSGVVFQSGSAPPSIGTDAYDLFNGFVDLNAGTGSSMEIVGADHSTHQFSGLDTGDVVTYDVAGTALRGVSTYTNRWTLVTLAGADSATPLHSDGVGIVQVSPTQAALWTGYNSGPDQGFVVRWTDIDPGADGQFSLVSTQYTGTTPGVGTGTADGTKGYGLSAIRFEEIWPSEPSSWLMRSGNVDTDTADDFQRIRQSDPGVENANLSTPFDTWVPAVGGLGFHASQPEFDTNIRTDVGATMQGVNASIWTRIEFAIDDLTNLGSMTLRMKYDDGFIAFLNGTPIASQNAPTTYSYDMAATGVHSNAEAVQFEEFDVSEHLGLLVEGQNVLAIWGMNTDSADADLLLLSELIAMNQPGGPQYMITPTPGEMNTPGALGLVDDTQFSVDRGFYEDPIDVAISTDTTGAEIRYTLDGSEPTATHGTIYTGLIHVTGQTVLRAVALKPGYLPSNVDTHSYIFVDDVIRQDIQATYDAGLPTAWGSTTANYGMDPDVIGTFDPVTGASNGDDLFGGIYATTIRDDLKSIPTMSIVLNVDDMFGANGIYSNTLQHGIAWERPTSVELLYPDGSQGFQVDAGIRIQGGYFRRPGATPKHSLRLLFKDDYGPSKLDFPLFGEDTVDRFDTLTLRAGANDGYSWNAAKLTEQYTRDQFGRDLQRASGNPGSDGTFVHLYINGVYWGLYNPVERPDHSFSASYIGGEKENWDSLNSGSPTNGDKVVWNAMLAKSQEAATSNDAYLELQGRNPDGSRDPALPHLMDVPNYVDYMAINIWGGNWDWPGKNWWAGRDRTDQSTGYKFYAWDFENTIGNNRSRSPLNKNVLTKTFTSVGAFHASLKLNDEYRMLFADRVHRMFFNDGILMPENLTARYSQLANTVEHAIVGESARWGDQHYSTPLTLQEWYDERDWVLNTYLPNRSGIVLQQLIDAGFYPSTEAPAFGINGLPQHGGIVQSGDQLTMAASSGTIYYTLDGTDPREFGGAISPEALVAMPVALTDPVHVMARTYDGGEWSALNEAEFYVSPALAGNLAITELNYHPHDPSIEELAVDPLFVSSDFEFVELLNLSDQPIDLTDVRFSKGIDFDFSTAQSVMLPAGEFALIVSNEAAFTARYGTLSAVIGQYTGHLNDGGEQLTLLDALGTPIHDFEFNDSGAWPGRADGKGSSLEVIDPVADLIDDDNWRSSSEYAGSPGVAGMGSVTDIVINEVLTHTDPPQTDSIELFNTTSEPIEIGGWYLSDSSANYQKFRIPDGMVLPGGGYLVFDESDFNPVGSIDPNNFAFDSAHGDDAWLLEADTSGKLLRFVDHVEFGAAVNGESFGRWPNGSGNLYPMLAVTLDANNTGPRVGPVVISELMYQPFDPGDGTDVGDLEYVEILNPTSAVVDLSGWQLGGGVDFLFADGTELAAGGVLVVVSFDPLDPLNAGLLASFHTTYGIDAQVALTGGYTGRLDDDGETVRLLRPDEPPVDEPDFSPMLLVDEVRYNDALPWPTEPGGGSTTLNRRWPKEWGSDPLHWTSEFPTPGNVDFSRCLTLDVDDNGSTDALTDGILILRYLFGFNDLALVNGALSPGARRTDPDIISTFLESGRTGMLDVDANGTADALTDGIMILRYLFGFSGESVVNQAIMSNAQRADPEEIGFFLDVYRPEGLSILPQPETQQAVDILFQLEDPWLDL